MRQFIHMVVGFGLGQGLFLVAQLLFIKEGHNSEIVVIAITVGLLSFYYWFCDTGGIFIFQKKQSTGDRRFFDVFYARLIVCTPLALFINVYILGVLNYNYPIKTELLIILLVVSSFNVAGIIDYHKKNAKVALLQNLNFIFSSIYIFLLYPNRLHLLDVNVLTSVFITGTTLTMILQHSIVHKDIDYVLKVKFKDILKVFSLSIFHLFIFIVAQGYARFLPVLLISIYSDYLVSYFILLRNVTNVFTLMVTFIRRIKFSTITFDDNKQKKVIMIPLTVLLSVSIFAVGNILNLNSELTLLFSIFPISLLVWYESNYKNIELYKSNLEKYTFYIFAVTVTINLVFMKIFLYQLPIYAVLIAETLMFTLQVLMFNYVIKHKFSKVRKSQ